MSGDNLHGKQPIKFYSEELTIAKIELIEKQLRTEGFFCPFFNLLLTFS